jgi:prephenate dehydrogenase
VEVVEDLVRLCGGVPVWLTPEEHDRAVARTSHVPHLLSVLAAARLAEGPENHLALSGQGVRDVLDLLTEVRAQLDSVIAAVGAGDRAGLEELLATGVAGTRVIPAKHGGPARPMRSVWVSVPDHPGELARLLGDAVASEVNVEDIRIDHDPGRPVGLVELVVEDSRAEHLLVSLESRGWETHR